MNLANFGATGGTGRQLVDQALEEDYAVTVLVRNPAVFPLQHERLSLVEGDVRDRARVEAVVTGQDAILSALGTNQRGPTTLCTDGIERILTTMAHARVRRLLVVSAYGAAESHHRNLYNLLLWTTLKEKCWTRSAWRTSSSTVTSTGHSSGHRGFPMDHAPSSIRVVLIFVCISLRASRG